MKREAFLQRVTDALAGVDRGPIQRPSVPDHYRENPFGDEPLTPSEWPERFAEELDRLGGVCHFANSAGDAGTKLREVLETVGAKHIVTWGRNEFAGWDIDWLWDTDNAVDLSERVDDAREVAISAEVGVTAAQAAIANTGTVVLTAAPTRPRLVSLAPTVHVALVKRSDLVARMGDSFAMAVPDPGNTPSSLNFITGPSRSSDIENDLSIGVHGPAALHVIFRTDI